MIETRKDWHKLVKATESCRGFTSIEDLATWITMPNNIMFIEGRDVGVASFEYPGLYTVHWYFLDARGREAIDLGKRMCSLLFTEHDAELLRGLIKEELRASRWACRQLGFKSLGKITFADGDVNEMFVATKNEFMKGLNNG